jgi:serine/threonine protein kinase
VQASSSDKKPAESSKQNDLNGSENNENSPDCDALGSQNIENSRGRDTAGSENIENSRNLNAPASPPGRALSTDDVAISTTDPLIGKKLSNEYEIVELIGTGGWSRVYKAKQSSSDDYVAVKVLHSHLLFDQESVSRFEREARSGASLSHPNICRIFDYNRLDTGQPYIVMEFLNGESFSSVLRRKGKLDADEALPIFIACCRGLEAAHSQGIVHRDVKPANIFLINDEKGKNIKLLDFGMAKIIVGSHLDLTQTGTAFGTVQYMSPEQILAESIDGRSDLYALGCVMFESLTGKKVFEGRTAYSVMEQHVRTAPKRFKDVDINTNVSPALEGVVMRTLAKSVDKRFQTAEELVSTLESLKDLSTARDSATTKSSHWWWILGLSLLATLALILFSH